MTSPTEHEPHGKRQANKATASAVFPSFYLNDLGNPAARPAPEVEYERPRSAAITGGGSRAFT